MTSMEIRRRVGEVIVSHTERVEVQCYELHSPPPLGSLLRIGSPAVYAVVRDIWHEPLDPSRPLAARGADLETEERINRAGDDNGDAMTSMETRAALAASFGVVATDWVSGCLCGGAGHLA